MKAIDIATRNHVTMKDMLEVCKELEITCQDENTELNDKNIFLIEKKIESLKQKLAEKNERARKGKKIKLKRKVHVSKEIIDKTKPESEAKESSAKEETSAPKDSGKEQKPAQKPAQEQKRTQRPEQKKSGSGDRKPGSGQRDRKERSNDSRGDKPRDARVGGKPKPVIDGKQEAPVADGLAKDTQKRKKDKGKEKEKIDKRKFKKEPEERRFNLKKKGQEQKPRPVLTPDEINITENISVGELAKKLNVKANEVIAKLMKMGVMAMINQVIDSDTAELLADEYGTKVKVVSLFDETIIRQDEEDKAEDHAERPPVVTVMGHVDHGKTKLLDAIRSANKTDEEHGGITQHIGAYMVDVNGRRITFLDTPGHEAFTTMRARGAGVTDIVILVVAANDGVMPQTKEAINHARDAGVPIIVAINKIDLPDANIDKVKQELANYELIPEEWGGSTLFAEISAKQKINIEGLLELILIQSEMLELEANPTLLAKGTVIEAKLDPGRGAVSTILVQEGTLSVGDPYVVGIYSGKVRAMFDDAGNTIDEAGPSTPVEILGISGVPGAGDPFECVATDRQSKQVSQKRLEYKRIESAKKVKKVTLESLNDMIRDGEVQELRVIVKADVDGSAQALTESLEKLSNEEVRVKVIHTGTGGINESDVMLASASNAVIIGYHVRPAGKVAEIAEREKVDIKFYNIIFEVTDDIKAAMEGMLSPEISEEITSTGKVQQVFKISKIGTVAGALLESGKIERQNRMRLLRDGVVIFDGEMSSLKRFKDDVSLVQAGQEFGFGLVNFNDIKDGDTFESYRIVETAKTL